MTEYFATVAPGLENLAAKELESLGASSIQPEFTGVKFTGDQTLLYRVNLWSRIIFRVLVPISKFRCYHAEMLYKEVQKIAWENYLTPQDTFAVHCTGSNPQLNHTHFTALQVKNAIIDQQRQRFGKRSSIEKDNPDLSINIHIDKEYGIISLDSSGSSLHRRGYHPAMGVAPLKETLASALLDLAEYDGNLPFLDPLCGSGTLPIEAALKALNIAPGLYRDHFSFMNWPDFDPQLWRKICKDGERSQLTRLKSLIMGSDQNPDVINQAKINAEYCGFSEQIQFIAKDFADIEPPSDQGIIICNPPYGERLGNSQELGDFYQLMGDIFKQRFKGWTAYILTGNKELAKRVGLRTSRKFPVNNGGIPCTLLKYELY